MAATVKIGLMARDPALAGSFDPGSGVAPPQPLGEHDVHVWIVALVPGTGASRDALSPGERATMTGFGARAVRDRNARSHVAARRVLAGYLGCDPRRVSIRTNALGKPQVTGGDLHYSLAHAGRVALVGVGRGRPLGVDVEPVRRLPEREALLSRCFTTRERAHVDACDDEDVLRLWVRKEAIAKATGEGLAQVFDGIDVLSDRPLGGWRLVNLVTAAGHVAAAAVRDDAADIVVTRFPAAP